MERVKKELAEIFPKSHVPHGATVRQLIDKFGATGSVADAQRSGRPQVLTEDKALDIHDRIMQSPKKSIRKLSQQASHIHQHRALRNNCTCIRTK
jgi:hypothetical protein